MVKNCPPGPLPKTTPKAGCDPAVAVGVGVDAKEGLANAPAAGVAEAVLVGICTCPGWLVVQAASNTTRVTTAKRHATESITSVPPLGHDFLVTAA